MTTGQGQAKLIEHPDMGIVMPDGVRLSARVWMPDDAAMSPVPAILEYIPYRKRDGTLPRDEMMHPYFAAHGYAAVRVDMRGNGDSQGLMTDEYAQVEMDDALSVITWIAAQPWCSGAVGMMGKSWGGFNCLQTAFNGHPALKAVVSVCSTTDRFADDIHFKGGCLLGENFGWGSVMLSYSSRPADPILRNDWRADWLARLAGDDWMAPHWARHQARDAYWAHGSVGEDYSRMTIPVQIWGGWADNYMNTVAALVANTPAPCKGIVGPWVHQYPHTAVPGPKVGFLDEALRWWDRWLKGTENGVEHDPAMRAYMLHSAPPDASAAFRPGHWVAEPTWPPERGSVQQVFLTDAGLSESLGPLKTTIATPQHLGLQAGEFFPMGLNAEMPGDQAADDALSVCYDGSVLEAPLDLLGAARLTLRLSSDQPLGFVVARLCDVAPDGSSIRIAHGMLNLCHRNGAAQPLHLVPGQGVDVAFDLDQMGYRVAAGHRLRVALSNSYWPFVWPSPQAGTLTVTAGTLTLPLHQGSQVDEWTPPPVRHASPWKHDVLRTGKARRFIEADLVTGTRALVVQDDGGDVENLQHGLKTGETMSERWEIHPDDPASARAVQVWEQRLTRGSIAIRTLAETEMSGDAANLRMQARLRAWEGEVLVFDRTWDDLVDRRFV